MRKVFEVVKELSVWKISTAVLGLFLVVSLFFDVRFSLVPKWGSGSRAPRVRGGAQSAGVEVSRADPEEIYEKVLCPCCGKSIAECTCPMSKERQDFVDDAVDEGLGERAVYKRLVKEYGGEALLDEALAAEIQSEMAAEAPADRPILSLEPESANLGEVSMAEGDVETTFKVKNTGKSDLEISGMETSCGCTTAVLKVGGRESPVFGMSDNPTDWSEVIKPGQEAKLVAIFDPAHHGPKGVGPATRTISVRSSDPVQPVKKVQFEVDVTK